MRVEWLADDTCGVEDGKVVDGLIHFFQSFRSSGAIHQLIDGCTCTDNRRDLATNAHHPPSPTCRGTWKSGEEMDDLSPTPPQISLLSFSASCPTASPYAGRDGMMAMSIMSPCKSASWVDGMKVRRGE